MNRRAIIIIVAACLGMAIGASPRYIEELRIGGGLNDPVDGGSDFEKNGNILSNGSLSVDGNVSAGRDEAVDHSLSVTTGTNNKTFVNLYETNNQNGGAFWFDANTEKLYVGTRNGSTNVTNALEIERGNANVTAKGDLSLEGGDITSPQTSITCDPSGAGLLQVASGVTWAQNDAGALWLVSTASGPTSGNVQARLKNSAGALIGMTSLWLMTGDAAAGSEDGLFKIGMYRNGTIDYEVVKVDSPGNMTLDGDLNANGGDVTAGEHAAVRGVVTAWDGSGGNAPGCVKLASPNGTVWYLFVEDDGTVKIHNALPTQNSDGAEVGGQS